MGATRRVTLQKRQAALQMLKDNIGKPVHNLSALLEIDKSTCTRHVIGWLRGQGHDITALHNGYILRDTTPAETKILLQQEEIRNMVIELKTMVAGLTVGQIAPVVHVPECVPEIVPGAVPSDKSGTRKATPKASAADGHLSLIAAITEAHKQGRLFTKTGRLGSNGIHARRSELPEPYNSIGRDRLERIVSELVNIGQIKQDEGGLVATAN